MTRVAMLSSCWRELGVPLRVAPLKNIERLLLHAVGGFD